MAVPTGRSDKRIAKGVAVELARLDHLQLKETAITQNVRARGVRVATEHLWRPGDRVLLSSPECTFHSRACVVCLLSAHRKQRICCRFGTCRPAGSDSLDGLIGVGPFFQKLYLGDSSDNETQRR